MMAICYGTMFESTVNNAKALVPHLQTKELIHALKSISVLQTNISSFLKAKLKAKDNQVSSTSLVSNDTDKSNKTNNNIIINNNNNYDEPVNTTIVMDNDEDLDTPVIVLENDKNSQSTKSEPKIFDEKGANDKPFTRSQKRLLQNSGSDTEQSSAKKIDLSPHKCQSNERESVGNATVRPITTIQLPPGIIPTNCSKTACLLNIAPSFDGLKNLQRVMPKILVNSEKGQSPKLLLTPQMGRFVRERDTTVNSNMQLKKQAFKKIRHSLNCSQTVINNERWFAPICLLNNPEVGGSSSSNNGENACLFAPKNHHHIQMLTTRGFGVPRTGNIAIPFTWKMEDMKAALLGSYEILFNLPESQKQTLTFTFNFAFFTQRLEEQTFGDFRELKSQFMTYYKNPNSNTMLYVVPNCDILKSQLFDRMITSHNCDVCHKEFLTEKSLADHLTREHDSDHVAAANKESLTCQYCDIKIDMTIGGGNKDTCSDCLTFHKEYEQQGITVGNGSSSNAAPISKSSSRKSKPQQVRMCPICAASFLDLETFVQHLEKEHDSFYCCKCGSIFEDEAEKAMFKEQHYNSCKGTGDY